MTQKLRKPLIIWGGEDINPQIYGESVSRFCGQSNKERDILDFNMIKAAHEKGQPIIGVCRGAQTICVAHGGKLWQHSVPSKQHHSIATINGDIYYDVAAGHHQIMRPVGHYQLIGWNPEVTKVSTEDDTFIPMVDCAEIVYYPNTRSLAIQPHPEWETRKTPFVKWLNSYIEKLDIDYYF